MLSAFCASLRELRDVVGRILQRDELAAAGQRVSDLRMVVSNRVVISSYHPRFASDATLTKDRAIKLPHRLAGPRPN